MYFTYWSNSISFTALGFYKMAHSFPEKYVSVDVECIATGKRHDDREVCYIAVVDQH